MQAKVSIHDAMLAKASQAAALFEARWTVGALRRAEPDLCAAVLEQLELFHNALARGADRDVREHGEAMCRGWHAAITAMEKSGVADDAIHIGEFGQTMVAIGRQQYAPEWLRERYGAELVWLTPREVAAMFFQIREVETVKALWPDAEITDVRNKENME